MKPVAVACLSLLLVTAFWQSASRAQTHSPTPRAVGQLKGLVVDSNEARVPGAIVTLVGKENRVGAESNDEGAFEVKLPAGEYQLQIEREGFKVYRKKVRIEADKTESINATLRTMPPVNTIRIK